jgi:hypothetical protein
MLVELSPPAVTQQAPQQMADYWNRTGYFAYSAALDTQEWPSTLLFSPLA